MLMQVLHILAAFMEKQRQATYERKATKEERWYFEKEIEKAEPFKLWEIINFNEILSYFLNEWPPLMLQLSRKLVS